MVTMQKGTWQTPAPDLRYSSDWYLLNQLKNFRTAAVVTDGSPTRMESREASACEQSSTKTRMEVVG